MVYGLGLPNGPTVRLLLILLVAQVGIGDAIGEKVRNSEVRRKVNTRIIECDVNLKTKTQFLLF